MTDASSNRVCTCVDAGYVVGSDPNCPRHAIPNRAAEYDDAVPGAPGWSQPLRRATPNRVASSFRVRGDGEMRCNVCGTTYHPAPGMGWEHTCYG